jgi:hypothetical protein
LLIAPACSKKAFKPGVTYEVTVITPGAGGQVAPQGSATRVEGVIVGHVQEVPLDGRTVSLAVRKTEYGRATFDVSFPDQVAQMVRVKTGETKEVLPEGQKSGLRIAVQECR